LINDLEKGSNPGVVPVSEKYTNMINQLPPKDLKIFTSRKSVTQTLLDHRTKDPMFVKERLGKKNIQNTVTHITIEQTLFQQTDEESTVKVALTPEKSVKLLEVGLQYHSIHRCVTFVTQWILVLTRKGKEVRWGGVILNGANSFEATSDSDDICLNSMSPELSLKGWNFFESSFS